jgi:hypothetical protein
MTVGCTENMRPNISEFSYGFALTHELALAPDRAITAAPVFPSLFQEGQEGFGWDVQIPSAGVPLFLQFKLCDYMTRRSCFEVRDGGLDVPCYRMHLRSAPSRQHQLLLDLEARGNEVYYSAPAFHEPHELNEAFLTGSMRTRSVWIKPSDIGDFSDEKDHHVSFEPGGPWKVFSTPREIKKRREFKQVEDELVKKVERDGVRLLTPPAINHLAEEVQSIAERREDIAQAEKTRARVMLSKVQPLGRVAYYASVFLESQMFVIGSR